MLNQISTSLLLLSWLAPSEALRILVCYPMTSKSHSILGHGVVNRLLEAGHEVVHITSYPREKLAPNLTELDVSSLADEFKKYTEHTDAFKLKNLIGQANFGDTLLFSFFTFKLHKNFLELPSVNKLFSDPNEKFDAVILEWFFSELNAGIPALFQCPMIWVCSTEPHWQALRIMDEIPNPAYSTDLFTPYELPLTFWQRVHGLWRLIWKTIATELIIVSFEKWVYYSVYPDMAAKRGITMPSYQEAVYNGSLMFVNTHTSVGGSMKLPQNVISIAGYHIDKQIKPLPRDLQKFMDEAKHGVIYFSLGSIAQSDGMSEEMVRSLLDMFSKYKQTVIWKFESDLADIPANVHLIKWAPQQSILAHPNLKLFITHGGQLSTTEAIQNAVPLVGIPIMADQYINMRAVTNKGLGIKVTLAEDMVPELDAAVKKVLSDEKYKNKAKELSLLYHDRIISPGAELAHWVEHVVRTRGAPHLRSPAVNIPLYQKLYLDLAVLITLVIVILRYTIKYLLRKRSSRKEKSS